MSGQIVWSNAEPVLLKSETVVAIGSNMILESLDSCINVADASLHRKALKGWTIYPQSEMRQRIGMITQGIKAVTGLADEYLNREQITKDLNKATSILDRVQGLNKTPTHLSVNREEAIKQLKAATGEFVNIPIQQETV